VPGECHSRFRTDTSHSRHKRIDVGCVDLHGAELIVSRNARDLIADPANEVIVSAGTVWEIAIKRAMGKLDASDGLAASSNDRAS
jgi:hypothetical protein